MKNMKKLFATILLTLTVIMGLQMGAFARNATTNFSFTDNSVTISWTAPQLYSGSKLVSYALYDTNARKYFAVDIPATQTSYTINGLTPGFNTRVSIKYAYVTSYGKTYSDMTHDSLYINTTPPTLTKDQFGIDGVLSTTQKVCFAAQRYTGMSGAEVELYKGNKKVNNVTFLSSSVYVPVSKDVVYKYRVRTYYTNYDTQSTVYGAWSQYKYFDMCGGKVSYNYRTNGCDITVKKVKDVKNYVVQVSTDRNGGFKKTATITVTGKKKTIHVEKIGKAKMKNRTNYYIRILPMIKAGGSTVSSEVFGTHTLYNTFR